MRDPRLAQELLSLVYFGYVDDYILAERIKNNAPEGLTVEIKRHDGKWMVKEV